jgi:hypothetical protein
VIGLSSKAVFISTEKVGSDRFGRENIGNAAVFLVRFPRCVGEFCRTVVESLSLGFFDPTGFCS